MPGPGRSRLMPLLPPLLIPLLPLLLMPLLLMPLLMPPALALPHQDLFPYGPARADLLLQEGDDETSPVVQLRAPLPFYEAQFGSLYVGTNGIISTQDFPRETQYVDDDFPTDFPAIAPFLSDIDTSNGRGKVYYREDDSEEVLSQAARYVHMGFPSTAAGFTPTRAFVATWEDVGAYEEVTRDQPPSSQLNTFQAVLAYDESDAYALFLYPASGLQFFGTRPKESYNVHLELPARVGFSRGEVDHLKREGPHFSVTSTEQSVKNLYQMSNLGLPGVWAFHIGSSSQLENVVPATSEGSSPVPPGRSPVSTSLEHRRPEDNLDYAETFYDEDGDAIDYPPAGSLEPELDGHGPTGPPPPSDGNPRSESNGQELRPSGPPLPQPGSPGTASLLPLSPRLEDGPPERGAGPPAPGERVDPPRQTGEEGSSPWEAQHGSGVTGAPPSSSAPAYPPGRADVPLALPEGEAVLPGYPLPGQAPPFNHGKYAVGVAEDLNANTKVFTYSASGRETCERNHGQCSQYAFCTDYATGFCCHCQSKYYGDGKHCLPEGMPHRVNGKVSGQLGVGQASVAFDDVDLHAYIVGNDGRAYTAISHIPEPAAPALLPLVPIGGLFGWLFALEKPGYQNGFRIAGAEFTHEMEVSFHPGEEQVHITQTAEGLDPENYLTVRTMIRGRVPAVPENSTLHMGPYEELYRYHSSGVTSTASREYTLVSGGVERTLSYRVRQNFTYLACGPAGPSRAVPASQQLRVDRVFALYSAGERVLRFAVTSHVGPIEGDADALTVNPCSDGTHTCHGSARCLAGAAGPAYTCECTAGFQGDGRHCEDVDECATGSHHCGPNSHCINSPGSYRCLCHGGSQLAPDGRTCVLVSPPSDPCEDGSHNCGPPDRARCVSHGGGSFSCECLPGYVSDGPDCADVDECAEGRCHHAAACHNSPGSFTCHCQAGYRGDGFQCVPDPVPGLKLCEYQRRYSQAEPDFHIPQCDEQGDFRPVQCHGSTGYCWCVDQNGLEIGGTRTPPGASPPRCATPEPTQRPQTFCERWRQNLLEHYGGRPREDQYVPQCDQLGEFRPLQCHGNSDHCWCVGRDGRELEGTRSRPGVPPPCLPSVAPPTAQPSPRPDVNPPATGTFLLYAQGQQIGYLPLNGTRLQKDSAKTLLSLHGSIVVGIDYDCRDRTVYWTDVAGRLISRTSLEPGSEPETIINSGLMSPEGLTIDYFRRIMFWTDSGLDKIESAKLDGSERRVLFDTDLVNPRAITVDPIRGNLYWTDWNREAPKIEVSSVDGTGRRILVNKDIGLPNALTYDPFSKLICWADAGTKRLECTLPDGTGRRVVQNNLNYPFSIVSYANHFYHTDWRRDGVIAVNKDTGHLTDEFLPEQRSHLYGITAVYPYCPTGRK
ncbi:nidogen-2 [Ornithorhynchus anatinus]|uniref:nidogen-2 n=1 Tax=Ornithorhynchus anatinus TaxID=9258 RepID=UPI0010A802B7|nr:nidogen-2 [Ornithorhynchus anatinus]